MYAVISSGGKQYRIQAGETIKLESMQTDVGEKVSFDKVLMIGEGENVKIGQPYIDGSKITATVISHGRYKKIRIVKFRRRKHQLKWQGHRQDYTEVKIDPIEA